MSDAVSLSNERTQMYKDLYRGNVPTRIPVSSAFTLDAMILYAGMDIAEIYWDMTKAEAVFDKVCQDFFSDSMPGGTRRYPSFYQLLGSKPFIMGSTGTMQHPNVMGMGPEEYDEFIASPYDCIIEKILPRLYTELDSDPFSRALALAKAARAHGEEMATTGMIAGKMRAKYGFAAIPGNATTAPYDFMADFFRSFTGISKDIRRIPDKVVEACDAITPILIKKGKIPVKSEYGVTVIPLHMAPYMRTQDFEKFWWPSFKKQVDTLSEMGINVSLFVEHDFMRYLDHLYELPENTIMRFEYGDPKLVKEKLGKKHIISGFYPLMLLHTGTKEQCIDKAKELLDILAPGGHFMFDFDKNAFDLSGNIVENLKAVQEYVYLNGRYSEAERAGNTEPKPRVNRTDEIIAEIDANMNSKYFSTWSQYKEKHTELFERLHSVAAPKIEKFEDVMFNFIINLCS
ncbi:uroporphyrinogen decarboxylase (URO-D) [Oxobacter pfennigii]|uniref:Uroporphyrinogen decarboxylase (URO-D) n=1 Tax=Oxobacter pfennigii TaxID=36849 RepID=A0A0P8W548_9CLOT|nr:uroporphyrinogen decarboxylase family protein [Oxobacter pfennigii]KPU43732.1 uroporphyrinogen decarboxylase (URO-D) [Oxobacter pfennigii]